MAAMMQQQSGLPSGYTEVAGVKQDTGSFNALALSLTKPFVVKLDATINSLTGGSGSYSVFFGANSNLQLGYNQAGNPYVGNASNTSITLSTGQRYSIEGKFATSASDAYYYIDGVDTGLARATSASTFYVLSATSACSFSCRATLHSLQIYQNDVLTYDFIPCKRDSDSVYGLYDIINEVFYETAWTE